jgi:hypothetical protein
VHSNSHLSNNSYTHFPSSYEDITRKGDATFTGSLYFRSNEVEVYSVVQK